MRIYFNKDGATGKPSPMTSGPSGVATPSREAAVMERDEDVAAVLDRRTAETGEGKAWRQSAVELMRLCGLDASYAHRVELAQRLGYGGDVTDSEKLNIWLHGQIMTRLAESGGTLPDELRA